MHTTVLWIPTGLTLVWDMQLWSYLHRYPEWCVLCTSRIVDSYVRPPSPPQWLSAER